MPLDEGETLSRASQQLRKACTDVSTATTELGTVRDAAAREKLRKVRQLVAQCEAKVKGILAEPVHSDLAALHGQYNSIKAEFDVVNKEATRREKQTWHQSRAQQASAGEAKAAEGVASVTKGELVRLQDIKKIDMSEFQTEEALQREKLLGVKEVESKMLELKTTYQEFQDLVYSQQSNLDNVTENVVVSKVAVENGTNELRQATKRQGCGRKFLCAGAIVLVIILIIVLVIVFTRR